MSVSVVFSLFFFFQAEDGIRDRDVTGVQTCALPICTVSAAVLVVLLVFAVVVSSRRTGPRREAKIDLDDRRGPVLREDLLRQFGDRVEIGRASCRERV